MKKSLITCIILVFGISLMFSACSKSAKIQEPAASNSSSTETSSSDTNVKRDVLIGKVDSILGNEVTLSVADIPENMKRRLENMGQGRTGQGSEQAAGQNSQQGTRLETGLQQGQQGQQRSFGGGGNFQNRNFNSSNRQGMQFKFTGEKKTIDIPVGVPIISFKRGANGMERTQLDLSNITEGNILYVLSENGNIVEVRVMNMSQQSQE